MNQQRLKLKPKRRRPTLGYVLALERRVLELQIQIQALNRQLSRTQIDGVQALKALGVDVRLAS
jgi:hypothetical protein